MTTVAASPTRLAHKARAFVADLREELLGADDAVDAALDTLRVAEARVRAMTGAPLSGLRVLELLPGPHRLHMRCLALRNDVTGVEGRAPRGLALPLVGRGIDARTLSSVVRKGLGVDARVEHALARRIGVRRFRPLEVRAMDLQRMGYLAGEVDLVCAFAFEDVAGPRAVLEEVKRILKPGGLALLRVRPPTSHATSRESSPRRLDWAHLRAGGDDDVVDATRLHTWVALFADALPGAQTFREMQPHLAPRAQALHTEGALARYGVDELLTLYVTALWRKPLR